MFCKAFYVCYQDMYYIDYIRFPTCSQLFWEPCWELFWSISQCSIRSIHLRSIRHENDNWPNFFSRSCFWPNRSLMFSVKVDRKPFGQSEIWSIRVLCYFLQAVPGLLCIFWSWSKIYLVIMVILFKQSKCFTSVRGWHSIN